MNKIVIFLSRSSTGRRRRRWWGDPAVLSMAIMQVHIVVDICHFIDLSLQRYSKISVLGNTNEIICWQEHLRPLQWSLLLSIKKKHTNVHFFPPVWMHNIHIAISCLELCWKNKRKLQMLLSLGQVSQCSSVTLPSKFDKRLTSKICFQNCEYLHPLAQLIFKTNSSTTTVHINADTTALS